jgi:nitroreductase
MEFTQLIAQRYSCKNFGTGKVDAAALHTILEAGRLAPTAKNTQEQRIYVVQSEEGLAKIDAATPCRYGAPVCLVVAYDKNHTFTYPGERMNSGMEDAAIVATRCWALPMQAWTAAGSTFLTRTSWQTRWVCPKTRRS